MPRRPQLLPHYTHHSAINHTLDTMRVDLISGARNCAMLETLYSTACRTTELRLLDVTDVDAADNTITVARHTHHERALPLTPAAVVALNRYLAMHPHNGALFVNDRGYRLSARSIRRALPHTPRNVRASALAALLARGADLRAVQTIAGHACLSTTERYEQLRFAALAKPID
jgi:site-specific recombinase XerD